MSQRLLHHALRRDESLEHEGSELPRMTARGEDIGPQTVVGTKEPDISEKLYLIEEQRTFN
eukprot:4292993-Pyramimonas_sp.AAC.1